MSAVEQPATLTVATTAKQKKGLEMYIDYEDRCDVSVLLGKTLSSVRQHGRDELHFITDDGTRYLMHHGQECCESVIIEDIIGELETLIGTPLLMAETESNSEANPEGIEKSCQDSFTWTFYKFATIKGYVTIRWYGESNGYYSESVDFAKLQLVN